MCKLNQWQRIDMTWSKKWQATHLSWMPKNAIPGEVTTGALWTGRRPTGRWALGGARPQGRKEQVARKARGPAWPPGKLRRAPIRTLYTRALSPDLELVFKTGHWLLKRTAREVRSKIEIKKRDSYSSCEFGGMSPVNAFSPFWQVIRVLCLCFHFTLSLMSSPNDWDSHKVTLRAGAVQLQQMQWPGSYVLLNHRAERTQVRLPAEAHRAATCLAVTEVTQHTE